MTPTSLGRERDGPDYGSVSAAGAVCLDADEMRAHVAAPGEWPGEVGDRSGSVVHGAADDVGPRRTCFRNHIGSVSLSRHVDAGVGSASTRLNLATAAPNLRLRKHLLRQLNM